MLILIEDVGNACHAERYEKRQRSFGAVRSGTKRIQAEDWNAFCRADSFRLLFLGRERPSYQEIDDIHRSIVIQCERSLAQGRVVREGCTT